MEYYRVRWLQDDLRFPEWIIAELDDERWELRKVEIFLDGSKGYASREAEFGSTALGTEPIPPLTDIAADPQFIVEEISAAEFEGSWGRRTAPDR